MHEVGLRLVDHQVLDRRVVAIRGQEAAKAAALLLAQRALPELPGIRRVLGHGEVLTVREFVVQDDAALGPVHHGIGTRARDRDDGAGGGGTGPAFPAHEGAQPALLRRQRDAIARGQGEEAHEVRGAVVVPVVEGIWRGAAVPDRRVQGRVVQHPAARQARPLDERRHPVERASLLGQGREVQHQHAGVLREAEYGEVRRVVVQDRRLVRHPDRLTRRREPPPPYRAEAHEQHDSGHRSGPPQDCLSPSAAAEAAGRDHAEAHRVV